jgi:hypothetical protein
VIESVRLKKPFQISAGHLYKNLMPNERQKIFDDNPYLGAASVAELAIPNVAPAASPAALGASKNQDPPEVEF